MRRDRALASTSSGLRSRASATSAASSAELAAEAGCTIKAVADHTGTIRRREIDIAQLRTWVAETGGVAGFRERKRSTPRTCSESPVDVFVPAALQNQTHRGASQSARLSACDRGRKRTDDADAEVILAERGIEVIPDILANAGGVIVSYFEWLQNKSSRAWSLEDVGTRFRDLVWKAHDEAAEARERVNCSRRDAAYVVALTRLAEVYDRRGIFP